jgi:hypothetical protein
LFIGVKWSATKWIHVGKYASGAEKPVHVERVIHVCKRRKKERGRKNK